MSRQAIPSPSFYKKRAGIIYILLFSVGNLKYFRGNCITIQKGFDWLSLTLISV